jgi:PIN domain nuclease of toxin-antitoxin system
VKLLLDSHVILWALLEPGKIAGTVAAEIVSPANLVFVSPASVWELEIKRACGKLDLPDDWVGALDAAGFVELPVLRRHAMTAARLPWHHRDPFDRMLIAQAQIQGLRFVSRDRVAAAYGVSLLEA